MIVPFTQFSLEDNWFDTVESLRGITEEQWGQLRLPMALVNAIKKRLSGLGGAVQ
jgi:hypothetical protein